MASARKRLVFVLGELFAPLVNGAFANLIFARGLRLRFAGSYLAQHLELELAFKYAPLLL
jgi:hypothetical protein